MKRLVSWSEQSWCWDRGALVQASGCKAPRLPASPPIHFSQGHRPFTWQMILLKKYQMFGHSRDARGILGKSSKSWPPSPQIKTPPKGEGEGGLNPLFTTDVQKTTRISLFFILQAFLILVGWNYTCNTSSIGLGGQIWPVTSMRRVGPPVLVELQRSHCCNWGHQAPPKAFIHTRGGQTIKFMPFLAPSKFPRKFAQTRGRGLLAKLFL